MAGVPSEEPLRLAKHKVIAQAFAKRHDLNNMGRLSISLHSMHDDPIGKAKPHCLNVMNVMFKLG